jgi:hypothetical protein
VRIRFGVGKSGDFPQDFQQDAQVWNFLAEKPRLSDEQVRADERQFPLLKQKTGTIQTLLPH